MANGTGGSGFLDYATRVGPVFGGMMGVFYALAYVFLFIKDHDISDLAQVCFGLGFAAAAVGLGHAVKKATDIQVSVAADRIVNTPGPDVSSVPQVQSEIDKINAREADEAVKGAQGPGTLPKRPRTPDDEGAETRLEDPENTMSRLFNPQDIVVTTLWQEARGEDQDGRVMVAEVIRNRTATKYFSDGTFESTCLWAYQFSGWNTNDRNRLPSMRLDDSDPLYQQLLEAWIVAQSGSDLSLGARLYYAKSMGSPPAWAADSKFLIEHGSHRFFF